MPGLKFDIFNPEHRQNLKKIYLSMKERGMQFFTCINHHPNCATELGGACIKQMNIVLGERATGWNPPVQPARVGVVACCKTKLTREAPARILYQSHLFKLSVAYITRRCSTWVILSAKHGLVMPNQILEPYNLALGSLSADSRRKWAADVHEQLMQRFGDGCVYMAISGAHYRSALCGFSYVENPTFCGGGRGLSLGQLKRFLNNDLHGKQNSKAINKALGR
jgi:hypothetical protein